MAGPDGDASHRDAADLGEHGSEHGRRAFVDPAMTSTRVSLGSRAPQLRLRARIRVVVVQHHRADHGHRAELPRRRRAASMTRVRVLR